MRKMYFFRTIRIISAIAIISVLFYLILPPQETKFESLKATFEDEELDILCVGASHIMSGINPMQMFNDKGYVSYVMGVGSQAPWQTYYYIQETCKVKKPKLIIYDLYTMGTRQDVDQKYKDYQTVSSLLDTPLSINKISAVLNSTAESKLSLLLRFPYMSKKRYAGFSGLTVDKFYGSKKSSFGYQYRKSSKPCSIAEDVTGVTDMTQIHPKNEKYLRLIINYCIDNDIELLLVNAPWPDITAETQRNFNYIGKVASEYDVPFINGCSHFAEIGMDFSTDNGGEGGHLSHSGVTKWTAYIEKYLSDNYDLPDRRTEPSYVELYNAGNSWLEKKVNKKK